MAGKGKVKLPSLGHIGVVVRDLDKTMEHYTSVFGIGPWRVVELGSGDEVRRGQKPPFKMRLAFASLGAVELELIQPVSGRGIHSEFLDQGREGLHHLGFFVTNEEKELMLVKLAEEGIGVTQGGKTGISGGSYAYLDGGKTGGVIFELIHRASQ